MKRWVAAFLILACLLFLCAVVLLAEFGVRVPDHLRGAPPPVHADAIARETNSQWSAVQIPAADGVALRAWHFRAPNDHGDAVLLFHGVADSRSGVLAHARMLLRHGYSVLTPDSRGHGESEGDIITYGVREAADVRAWAEWLARHHPAQRLYGLGESMGAAILLQSLTAGVPFRAVVAESPFATFREIASYRVAGFAGLRSNPLRHLLPLLIEPAFLYCRVRHGVDLYQASPLRAVETAVPPILLIHGTEDANVPPQHSERLREAGKTAIWRVPGGHHVDAMAMNPVEFETRVVQWFESHR